MNPRWEWCRINYELYPVSPSHSPVRPSLKSQPTDKRQVGLRLRFEEPGQATHSFQGDTTMAKIAKTGDRKKIMDTQKSTDCPKCSKATRIVKRVKDRERGVPGGVYISCSACDFFEKL